jgi:hypothetical protein
LLDVTQRCVGDAHAAERRALRYTSHYKANSEEFRNHAARAVSPEAKESCLRIAARYNALVELGVAGNQAPPDSVAIARVEDPLARARKLRTEAERQMAQAQALLAAMPSDDRQVAIRSRIALSGALGAVASEIVRETREIANGEFELSSRSRTKSKLPVATVNELRTLLDTTEECRSRAVAARHEAARYADHFRFQIEGFRRQAARARSPPVRAGLLRIAASYEHLAQLAETAKRPPVSVPGASDDDAPGASQDVGEHLTKRPSENAIAQARRHASEAQERHPPARSAH